LTQVCPEWIRVRPSGSPRFREVERVLREHLTLPLSGVLPRLASHRPQANGATVAE